MREQFKSGFSFIMASVGSAVGLGNIFRFPYLATKYGVVFLFSYTLLLLFLGIPLLSSELALGRCFKRSAVGSMQSVRKSFGFIGSLSAANSFVIMTYYCILFSFVLLCLVFSFRLMGATPDSAGKILVNYIAENGGFSAFTVLFLTAAWAAVLLCFGSAERLGKISAAGVIFSTVSLLFLAVFLGVSNRENLLCFLHFSPLHLTSFRFWSDSASQVFFSLSVMTGVMFSYGSFLPKKSGISGSVFTIAFFDLFISVIATVIYAAVGSDSDVGLLTCFSVYPAAFASVPGGFILAFFFYLSLALLCLDSVFSYLKSVTCALYDSFGTEEKKSSFFLCVFSFILGLLMLPFGFKIIDAVDRFATSFLTLFIGLAESFVFGWYLKPKNLLSEINRGPFPHFPSRIFTLSIKFFCPLWLAFLLFFEIFF